MANSANASFVRPSNVGSVVLTQCGSGIQTTITADTDLCALGAGWNDNLREVKLVE